MDVKEAIEWALEAQCDYVKQDTNEEDVLKYEALSMAIEALEKQIVKTNADKIRAMSDEELTEFLEKVELGEFWADVPWVDWLKQEVE